MNFTRWRFCSPSVREHRPLQGDLSPTKSRPEPKPILEVKRSFLAFQKAQDHDIWSRELGDMINFPKPVKPVLHLPQLEANRSNQLQTKHWRPGDQSRHSGGSSNDPGESDKSIPCTSNHRIRRIFIYHKLPYLDAFTLGAISDARPSHQNYHVLESFPAYPGVLICTRTHQIRPNSIRPEDRPGLLKLAKPTSIGENLQPNHFGSNQDVISTHQAYQKVPRNLTYPLKPTRFKEDPRFNCLEPNPLKGSNG